MRASLVPRTARQLGPGGDLDQNGGQLGEGGLARETQPATGSEQLLHGLHGGGISGLSSLDDATALITIWVGPSSIH